jgi:hypothetical protein
MQLMKVRANYHFHPTFTLFVREALQKVTQYEAGYNASSPLVVAFWEVVHEDLDLDQKKHLLAFTTGSSRVPIKVPLSPPILLGVYLAVE